MGDGLFAGGKEVAYRGDEMDAAVKETAAGVLRRLAPDGSNLSQPFLQTSKSRYDYHSV